MKTGIHKITALTLTSLIIMAASCAVNPPAQQTAKSSKNRTVFRLKNTQNNIMEARVYRFGFGDSIEIKFFNNVEYNETVTVRPDGRISLQRIGDIYVINMTPAELDEIITKKYSEILIEPDVTVIVRDFGGQDVYVMGEVENPGVYKVTKGMTLIRAIAAAGGPKNAAQLKSVILLRNDGHQRGEALRINLDMGMLQRNINNDLPVQAFDMVYVPRTFIADLSSFITQVYDLALPPFDVWSRYTYWYNRD